MRSSLRCGLLAAASALVAVGASAFTDREAHDAEALAVRWLLENQNPSGSWGSDERREVLVTATVLEALHAARTLDGSLVAWSQSGDFPQIRQAESWLMSRQPGPTRDLAKSIIALSRSDYPLILDPLVQALRDRQRPLWTGVPDPQGCSPVEWCDWHHIDHSALTPPDLSPGTGTTAWGAGVGRYINAWDTAAAIDALWFSEPYVSIGFWNVGEREQLLVEGASFVFVAGYTGEAWPLTAPLNGESFPLTVDPLPTWSAPSMVPATDPLVTGEVIGVIGDPEATVVPWLVSQLVSDGGGGLGIGAPGGIVLEETALAYVGLVFAGYSLSESQMEQIIAHLLSRQDSSDGSWNGDPSASGGNAYHTALALRALAERRVILAGDLDGDDYADWNDPDMDGDGVDNDVDAFPRDVALQLDLDGDGVEDDRDPDKDGDGFCNAGLADVPGVCVAGDVFESDPGAHSNTDPTQDSDPDASDGDIDGDGVLNVADAFPLDPTEWEDTDGDGIGNVADLDDDADGIEDAFDPCPLGEQGCKWWVKRIAAQAAGPVLNGDLLVYQSADPILPGLIVHDLRNDQLAEISNGYGGAILSPVVSRHRDSDVYDIVWGANPSATETTAEALYRFEFGGAGGPSAINLTGLSEDVVDWSVSKGLVAATTTTDLYFGAVDDAVAVLESNGQYGDVELAETSAGDSKLLWELGDTIWQKVGDAAPVLLVSSDAHGFGLDRVAGENHVVCVEVASGVECPLGPYVVDFVGLSDVVVSDGTFAFDFDDTGDHDILAYRPGSFVPLYNTGVSDRFASVAKDWVVWLQQPDECALGDVPPICSDVSAKVMARDLVGGGTYQLSPGLPGRWRVSSTPSVSGARVAWEVQDRWTGRRDVYLASLGPDTDLDGHPDPIDNCVDRANRRQCDVDHDGYGNACDADYNQDWSAGGPDFTTFLTWFSSSPPDPPEAGADHNCDGGIGGPDFATFKALQGQPPGPTGILCAGLVDCRPGYMP